MPSGGIFGLERGLVVKGVHACKCKRVTPKGPLQTRSRVCQLLVGLSLNLTGGESMPSLPKPLNPDYIWLLPIAREGSCHSKKRNPGWQSRRVAVTDGVERGLQEHDDSHQTGDGRT